VRVPQALEVELHALYLYSADALEDGKGPKETSWTSDDGDVEAVGSLAGAATGEAQHSADWTSTQQVVNCVHKFSPTKACMS
jgi:hypothetical protein